MKCFRLTKTLNIKIQQKRPPETFLVMILLKNNSSFTYMVGAL